jgi:hypothetical protein
MATMIKPGTIVDPDTVISKATETARDIFTYPPASAASARSDVTAASSSIPSPSGGAGITKIAEDTIRQALGWRYRAGDVRGFSAALNRSFTLEEDGEGRIQYKWTPQTCGVQADMGEITGAQASILEQARVSINYILPLLDGLKPLRVDSDEGDSAAVSGIVRMKLNAFLDELGRVGGPRVHRVDLIFEELLGLPVVKFKPTSPVVKKSPAAAIAAIASRAMVGGFKPGVLVGEWEGVAIANSDHWLKQLRELDNDHRASRQQSYCLLRQLTEEFGLDPQLANTVEEERGFTNALIIIDTVIALRTAWIGKRLYFDRSQPGKRFLGTQLVWLSRQLDVIAESVRECYAAMDSVYFGPAERDATDIHYEFTPDPEGARTLRNGNRKPYLTVAPLTVGELLEWVETFATQEGPQLLQDAGKDGVLAFRATLSRLIEWVEAAKQFSHRGHGNAPHSFFTARVERGLQEIETQLKITAERAMGITRAARPSALAGQRIADLPAAPNAKVTSVGLVPRPKDLSSAPTPPVVLAAPGKTSASTPGGAAPGAAILRAPKSGSKTPVKILLKTSPKGAGKRARRRPSRPAGPVTP